MITSGILVGLMAAGATTAGADGPAVEDSSYASGSLARPEIARFGDTFLNMYGDLQYLCDIGLIERPGEAINLATVKRMQSAMSCIGLRYGGKMRKAEFVFADDILDLVIIATATDDQDSLRKGLVEQFGPPSITENGDTVFMDAGVLLRTEPHSVLFFSDRMKDWYGKF
jgi:hypothetical protein